MTNANQINEIYEDRKKVKEYYNKLSKELNRDIVISSLEEAQDYLKKLHDLMVYHTENLNDIGQLKKFIHDQLTVGSDSQYSEKLHFLYELIQNVDDCSYQDASNCNLIISFDTQQNTITLEYNELGFTTENVFAISSIANSSKNKDEKKTQIGEKGIGFKSVFGIAHKVLIQSGYFSFSFVTDDFIIPVPEYDDYTYTEGTKLTLYLMENESQNLFSEIMTRYDHGKNIGEYLNDNPVIFLNNLTSICYKNRQNDFIKFSISREQLPSVRFTVEDNVVISVEKKTSRHHDSYTLDCYRFSKDIVYNKAECKSRYPDNDFQEKHHKIIAIALKNEKFKGSVYSFLPTKVKTNVPIIFHIPFKLKASREDIDDQNHNAWYKKTISELQIFTEEMYYQLSELEPKRILNYVPTKSDINIFNQRNTGSACFDKKAFMLMKPTLHSSLITNDRNESFISDYEIFMGEDDEYHCLSELVYVNDIPVDLAQKVLVLLEKNASVISADDSIKLSDYGIKVESKLLNQLSNHYLKSDFNDNQIMELFDTLEINEIRKHINLPVTTNVISRKPQLEIPTDKLKHIYGYRNYKKLFMETQLSKRLESIISITDTYSLKSYKIKDTKEDFIFQSIKPYAEKTSFGFISKLADLQFVKLSFLRDNDYIVTKDTFYYADIVKAIFHFFDIYTKQLDLNGQETMGMSFIRIEGETYDFKHNIKNDTDDPETFINKIHQRNSNSRRLLGNTYNKILRIIDNASVSSNIYLNELLQNANDAEYPSDEPHIFRLEIRNNDLIASYNEKGFTKQDIRAITDIGESTKIHVVESEGKDTKIGEKGIGFKSVFKIASSVEIHSGDYHFSLDKSSPTIPDWIPNQSKQTGTKIVLHLEHKFNHKYKDSELLNLVLGLSKFDEFHFFGKTILVEKKELERTYLINNDVYEYYVFKDIEAVEENALKERRTYKPNELPTQEIQVIFPKDPKNNTKGLIYCGLPTTIETDYPFSINARFELNTSREGIVQNDWNNEMLCLVSLAILKAYDVLKNQIGSDILQYLTAGPIINDDYFSKSYNSLEKRLSTKKLLKNLYSEWIPFNSAIVVDQLEIDVLNAYGETINKNFVTNSSIAKYNKKKLLTQLGVSFHTDKELFDELIEEQGIQNDLLEENQEIREKFFNLVKDYPKKEELFDYFYEHSLVPYKAEGNKIGFININEHLYYSSDKNNSVYSEEDLYYILDTDILDLQTYDAIVAEHDEWKIQKFGNEEFEKYQSKRIAKWINTITDLKERAEKVLSEYNRNPTIMKKAIEQFDYATKQNIVYKLQNGSYQENRYKFSRYQHTDTMFDNAFISEEYWDIATDLNLPFFLDISNSDDYPFGSIDTEEQLEAFLSFDFNYKFSLVYSLIEKEKIYDELLGDNLLRLVRFANGLNLEVLQDCELYDVPVYYDDNPTSIEAISVHCNNITFEIIEDFDTEDADEFSNLIEEIRYDIDSSSKLDYATKESIKAWISHDSIYQTNLKHTLILRTDEGEMIYLGRNIKTEKQVYSIIEEFLRDQFKYSLSFNKAMNFYDRRLMKRIGNNKYDIQDVLDVSERIPPSFKSIEDEKRLLCEPYEFKQVVYGGYAKRCPCCGARVHTELTGFRIAKLRQTYSLEDENYNILVDVPCCQNCFDAFVYADTYEINIDSLIDDGVIDMYVKLGPEIWRPNKFKPRLAHMGLIISMNESLYQFLLEYKSYKED